MDIEVFQPEIISFTYKDSPTECFKVRILPGYSFCVEKHNLENIGTWVHEFSEIALGSLHEELRTRYRITMASWSHCITLAHKIVSIATDVGIIMNDGSIEDMDGDDYWWHMITGVPPSFYYTRKWNTTPTSHEVRKGHYNTR